MADGPLEYIRWLLMHPALVTAGVCAVALLSFAMYGLFNTERVQQGDDELIRADGSAPAVKARSSSKN